MMTTPRAAGIAAILLVLVESQPASAARLLVVKIEHDGKVAQTSFYEDDGTADQRTIWSYLGHDPLAIEAGGTIVATEDPLKVRLAGPIVISISHAKNVLIEARVENLTLARARADRDRWYLPPDELKRAGTAAGLKMDDEPAPDSLGFWTTALGIVMFLVMVFVVGFILHRARAASTND